MKIATGDFVTINKEKYTVDIYKKDGTEPSSLLQLQFGEDPFNVEMDSDDDVFTPIRTSTGYTNIVVSDEDSLELLTSNSADDLFVSLRLRSEDNNDYENNENVVWCGFISQETYGVDWDSAPIEVQIPILDILKTLESVEFYGEQEEVTVVDMLQNKLLYFPTLPVAFTSQFDELEGIGDILLNGYMDVAAFIDDYDKGYKYDTSKTPQGINAGLSAPDPAYTYYSCLEAICNYLGYSLTQNGHTFIFSAGDCFSGKYYSCDCGGITLTEIQDTILPVTGGTISTDNQRYHLLGKNFIGIESDINEIYDDLDIGSDNIYRIIDDSSPAFCPAEVRKNTLFIHGLGNLDDFPYLNAVIYRVAGNTYSLYNLLWGCAKGEISARIAYGGECVRFFEISKDGESTYEGGSFAFLMADYDACELTDKPAYSESVSAKLITQINPSAITCHGYCEITFKIRKISLDTGKNAAIWGDKFTDNIFLSVAMKHGDYWAQGPGSVHSTGAGQAWGNTKVVYSVFLNYSDDEDYIEATLISKPQYGINAPLEVWFFPSKFGDVLYYDFKVEYHNISRYNRSIDYTKWKFNQFLSSARKESWEREMPLISIIYAGNKTVLANDKSNLKYYPEEILMWRAKTWFDRTIEEIELYISYYQNKGIHAGSIVTLNDKTYVVISTDYNYRNDELFISLLEWIQCMPDVNTLVDHRQTNTSTTTTTATTSENITTGNSTVTRGNAFS